MNSVDPFLARLFENLVFIYPIWCLQWRKDQDEWLSQAPGQKVLQKSFVSYIEGTAN